MNYKGKAEITFYVEREDQEIELTISGTSYFQAGRTTGPIDMSYPDEGETEIESITLDGKAWDGELTEKETALVEEKLIEAVSEDEGPDPPSQDDFDDYDPPSQDFDDED